MSNTTDPQSVTGNPQGVPGVERTLLGVARGGLKVVTGNFGDHGLILKLLDSARGGDNSEDFASRLDRPGYDACDRLLLMHDQRPVGHVHLVNQTLWFQGVRVPIVALRDVAVLPEYRGGPGEQELFNQAEACAVQEGAVLAIACTDSHRVLADRQWLPWRSQGFSRADTRALLAHLDAPPPKQSLLQHDKMQKLEVRTWRHVELDALRNVYDRVAPAHWGCEYRCEQHWQWLVGRKAIDHILVAVDPGSRETPATPSDDPDSGVPRGDVVGYAAIRDWRIVEMHTLPEYPNAAKALMIRAGRDAIDRNHHFLSLHTPASDPLHQVMVVTAGGEWVSPRAPQDRRWLYRMLSPERWVERLYPVLQERTRAADIPRPVSLNLQRGSAQSTVVVTRRSSRLEHTASNGAPPPNDAALYDLLTGNTRGPQNAELLPDEATQTLAGVLFPPTVFWQSPLELLRL
ncbi:MAG: GNAT family N-acetyltransferase [Planctomycetota bacterium]